MFPIGTAWGIIGVMLWPVFVWAGGTYPLLPHAGLMIQGFLASFVVGFLGTALPRLLGVRRLGLAEAVILATALCFTCFAHLAGWHQVANAAFLATLSAFVVGLLWRARHRQDLPPPGFVLVALGILCALVGTALQIGAGLWPVQVDAGLLILGKRFAHQGFLLLPIMGIGAFLLPRFFALPNRQYFPESLRPSHAWMRRAAFATACGAAVILSFVLEAGGWLRTGWILRAAAFLFYIFNEVPVHRAWRARGSLAAALRTGLFAIPIGYLMMAILPGWHMALSHIVFVTGFSLITLTIATRVLLGHSGQDHKFTRTLQPVLVMLGLLILAMLTRVSADWMPEVRMTHYAYAAILWALGALWWAIRLLPAVRIADES